MLFLLLLLLSVVCCQCLLLCHRPSSVIICLPLLVAITVYCCFACFVLFHVVSHCVAKLWLKLIWLCLQDRGKKDSVKKYLYKQLLPLVRNTHHTSDLIKNLYRGIPKLEKTTKAPLVYINVHSCVYIKCLIVISRRDMIQKRGLQKR